MKKILAIALGAIITIGISSQAHAKNSYNINRITGKNRYETSANISSKFSNSTVQNIIIASGNDFPDALSGSVLSKKLNAPILLMDKTIALSSNSISYIKSHLANGGTIYVLGGNTSINDSFLDYFKSLSYNVKRLGGNNRFDTNKRIVNSMNVEKGMPVFLVNGYGFADALSVSSIAASKGYPILMVNKSNLPSEIKDTLKEIQPSKVFIIGGEGSLNNSVVDELFNEVPSLDNDSIVRIGGSSRYETSLNVCKYFNLNSDSAVIASGKSFPDALSGSALAEKLNAPIILTDGSNIIEQKRYLDSTNCSSLIILGGKGSVSKAAEDILSGKEKLLFFVNRGYVKNNKRYIEGYFDKFITNLDEAREYEKETAKSIIWNDGDGTGDYLPDDGFDIAISNTVTLEVDDNVKISEIDFDSNGSILNVDKDFNSIIVGKYKDWPLFDVTLKDGLVMEMYQEYRP